MAELYDNGDLALALTTTLTVIETLTKQMSLIEKTVLQKARLRSEWEMLETVWGIGRILGLTIMYEAGEMSRGQNAKTVTKPGYGDAATASFSRTFVEQLDHQIQELRGHPLAGVVKMGGRFPSGV